MNLSGTSSLKPNGPSHCVFLSYFQNRELSFAFPFRALVLPFFPAKLFHTIPGLRRFMSGNIRTYAAVLRSEIGLFLWKWKGLGILVSGKVPNDSYFKVIWNVMIIISETCLLCLYFLPRSCYIYSECAAVLLRNSLFILLNTCFSTY